MDTTVENIVTLTLQSKAFKNGEAIPDKYTCQGENISPPLSWDHVPENTKSLVLIVDDPDAPDPDAPMMTWVHWVLYNIPPDQRSLAEDCNSNNLPAGAKQGLNDWKENEYGGPCPPVGKHRYFHKLYALDTTLETIAVVTKGKLETMMAGHIIEQTKLIGTYQK